MLNFMNVYVENFDYLKYLRKFKWFLLWVYNRV